MNFVETNGLLDTLPSMTPVADVQPATVKPAGNTKSFVTAMVLSMAIFPFTLMGLMSATNWVVDTFVISNSVAASAELSKPLNVENPQEANQTADAVSSNR